MPKKDPHHATVIEVVARNLRWHRQQKELTQTALARRSGVALSTLNEIENLVAKDVRLTTISALSRALGLSPLELFSDVSIPKSAKDRKDFLAAFQILEKLAKRM